MDDAPAEAKVPRARPRDRRVQIAAHAGELFSARGFHSVRMDEIAAASGITARALYRHYANKQALLSHVVIEDQERVVETIRGLMAQPQDLDHHLTSLADAALDSRRLSALWQREARHLSVDDYRLVRSRTSWIEQQFEKLLVDPSQPGIDPATRSWVVVSIVSGPGFYESGLSRRRLSEELVAASKRVLALPASTASDSDSDSDSASASASTPVTTTRALGSRREQLIDAAARAFRANGFGGVSIDDIGGEVGIAGPALYRYFDTKADILVAAITRRYEWLALEATRALNTGGPDEEVIAELVRGYIHVALEATDLLAVSLTEWLYLPEAVRERLERIRADYTMEWQRWLSRARPELPDALAAVLVNMARTIVDDCVRIPALRGRAEFPTDLTHATFATLGLTSWA